MRRRDVIENVHSAAENAIVKAKNDLALREALDRRISLKPPVVSPNPASDTSDRAADSLDSETLVREAHRVLLRYLPAVALPDELWEVRAMLDALMFGRDRRVHRDDVVRVARQIDRMTDSA